MLSYLLDIQTDPELPIRSREHPLHVHYNGKKLATDGFEKYVDLYPGRMSVKYSMASRSLFQPGPAVQVQVSWSCRL
jgi:hypothetical protein